MRSLRVVLTGLAAGGLMLAGCAADPATTDSSGSSTAGPSGTIKVYAAASLREAFGDIGTQFEQANPGTKVVLSFDGSATLATQINQGAPADVFASANTTNMDKIADRASNPRTFARNTLVIITPAGNPKHVESLADLANSKVKVAQCAAEQPCGAASLKAEKAAGISVTPATQETSVAGVVTKVTTGQVDAGLVYVTDATAAGKQVDMIKDPVFAQIVNDYPITVVAGAANGDGALSFYDYVLSAAGQKILASYGFEAP